MHKVTRPNADNRSLLLEQLVRYRVRYPHEEEVIRRFEEFVRAHEDCFERSLRKGHITGSAWVVDSSRARVLLTHHKKLGIWIQLGGHADGNPDVLAVALREACEESGLAGIEPLSHEIFDLSIHPILARGDVPEHLHYDVRYAFVAAGSEEFVVSDESHALAWKEIARLAEVNPKESLLQMQRKWLARGEDCGCESV